MRYIKNIRLWLAALLLLMLLTGCELLRSDDGAGDITSSVNEPKAATGTPPIGDAFPLEQAPDTGGVIYFQPSNPQLMTGSTMTIDIFVANVENMNGADIQINFNPTIIQLDDAVSNQEGVQIQPGNFLAPDFIAENEVNNQTGAISYIVIQIPPTPPVSGTGLMATLIVRGVNEGTSDLTFTSVLLTNSNIEQIPVTSQNGQIIVGPSTGEPTDTPTATTTPVDGATATPTFTATITPTITPSVTITATATITPTIEPTATPTFTPSPPPPPTATPYPQSRPSRRSKSHGMPPSEFVIGSRVTTRFTASPESIIQRPKLSTSPTIYSHQTIPSKIRSSLFHSGWGTVRTSMKLSQTRLR